MNVGCCFLLAVVCLVAAGDGEYVEVSRCCSPGEILKIVKNSGKRLGGGRNDRGDEYVPKCVRSRKALKDNLEGSTVTVFEQLDIHPEEFMIDGKNEKLVVFNYTEVMLPSCTLGRKIQIVSLKSSGWCVE